MATKAFELKKHIIKFEGFSKLVITPKNGGNSYQRVLSSETTIYVDQSKINLMVIEGKFPGSPQHHQIMTINDNGCEGFVFDDQTLSIIGVEDLRFLSGSSFNFQTYTPQFNLVTEKVELHTDIAGATSNMKSDAKFVKQGHSTCPK